MHDQVVTSTTTNGSASSVTDSERRRAMDEAVQDLPDPERAALTREDVATLREAELDELAELAERLAPA